MCWKSYWLLIGSLSRLCSSSSLQDSNGKDLHSFLDLQSETKKRTSCIARVAPCKQVSLGKCLQTRTSTSLYRFETSKFSPPENAMFFLPLKLVSKLLFSSWPRPKVGRSRKEGSKNLANRQTDDPQRPPSQVSPFSFLQSTHSVLAFPLFLAGFESLNKLCPFSPSKLDCRWTIRTGDGTH